MRVPWGALAVASAGVIISVAGGDETPTRRRKADWKLQDTLLDFNVLVDNVMYQHYMWPCDDPKQTAEVFCKNPTFQGLPPSYCDRVQELFRLKSDLARATHRAMLEQKNCEMQERFNRFYDSRIQLTPHEIKTVANALEAFPNPTNLLVWGAGFDSRLWCELNREGTTIFIEQSPDYAQMAREVLPKDGSCQVVLANYSTTVAQGGSLIGKEHMLVMHDLPNEVVSRDWDVILIDGPTGFNHEQPGRSQSIYMSSLLGHSESVVCMDDANRHVEAQYGLHYLSRRYANDAMLFGSDMSCYFT